MSRSTDKRRTVPFVIASLLALSACLEPIEPTPDSSPLSITPAVEAVSVEKVEQNVYSFSLSLRVRNTGTRNVYVDLFYRETDKLIDQKWEVAAESPGSNLFRLVGPGQTQQILHVVTYPPGRYPLFDNVRGLYRVGLRAFYGPTGTDPIQAQPAYSTPFVLVEGD